MRFGLDLIKIPCSVRVKVAQCESPFEFGATAAL
jgi:hypothetical protein